MVTRRSSQGHGSATTRRPSPPPPPRQALVLLGCGGTQHATGVAGGACNNGYPCTADGARAVPRDFLTGSGKSLLGAEREGCAEPPSTKISVPAMKLASPGARNATTFADRLHGGEPTALARDDAGSRSRGQS
ncbi:hypothetical protein WME90_20915 [Sorangium sp. So ce375]|uniref:hypothetical protein n=1 Tax=Sorangium sp. So ce375 TaxID=3133306 RepID=UPI003F5B3577